MGVLGWGESGGGGRLRELPCCPNHNGTTSALRLIRSPYNAFVSWGVLGAFMPRSCWLNSSPSTDALKRDFSFRRLPDERRSRRRVDLGMSPVSSSLSIMHMCVFTTHMEAKRMSP